MVYKECKRSYDIINVSCTHRYACSLIQIRYKHDVPTFASINLLHILCLHLEHCTLPSAAEWMGFDISSSNFLTIDWPRRGETGLTNIYLEKII